MFGKKAQGNDLFDDDLSLPPMSPPNLCSFMDDIPKRNERPAERQQSQQQHITPQHRLSEIPIHDMKNYDGFIIDGVSVIKLKDNKYIVRSKKFNSEIDLTANATAEEIGRAVVKFLSELSEDEKLSALDKLAHGEQVEDARQADFIGKSLGTIAQMIKEKKI